MKLGNRLKFVQWYIEEQQGPVVQSVVSLTKKFTIFALNTCSRTPELLIILLSSAFLLSLGKTFICKLDRLKVKQRRSR